MVAVDEHTVAIVPQGVEKLKDKDGKQIGYIREHLIFAADGRLGERRVVEMPSGKVIVRRRTGRMGRSNLRSQISNLKSQIQIRNPKSQIHNLKSQI